MDFSLTSFFSQQEAWDMGIKLKKLLKEVACGELAVAGWTKKKPVKIIKLLLISKIIIFIFALF